MKKIVCLCLSLIITLSIVAVGDVNAASYDWERTYTITKRANPYTANAIFDPYGTYAQSSYVKVDLRDAYGIPDSAVVKKVWVECERKKLTNPYFLICDYNIMLTYFNNGDYMNNWRKAPYRDGNKTQIFGFENRKVKDCWFIAFDCRNLRPCQFAAATLREFTLTIEYTK